MNNHQYTEEIDLSSIPAGNELTDRLRTRQMLSSYNVPQDPFLELITEYQCAALQVETKFRTLSMMMTGRDERSPVETIRTRIKTPDSIIRKLLRQGDPVTLESMATNIYDIAGVRVICSFLSDIFVLEDLFLRQDDITLVRRRDYISAPKPSGYRSLHLVVRTPIIAENWKKDVYVEVQMRTMAMDFWASLEHKLRYKKDLDPRVAQRLGRELERCAQESASLDKRMMRIRDAIRDLEE